MSERKDSTGSAGESERASERKAYREGRESALRELDRKLDELKQMTLDLTAGTRDDLNGAMRALGERRRAFVARMAELREASGDAWGDLTKGVDNSWDELEQAFGDLRKGVGKALGRFGKDES
jgi:hypothetical protein